MTEIADDLGERHLAVCRRFGETVAAANGKWDRRSPCDAWDARGVLEHVIGFHDVLLLRPLGLKPDRPRHDPRGFEGEAVPQPPPGRAATWRAPGCR